MTVGGSTIGSATTAPTAPLSGERVRASHQASGVPSSSRIKVVSPASLSVRPMAARSAAEKIESIRLSYFARQDKTVALKGTARRGFLHEGRETLRQRISGGTPGNDETLLQWLMQVFRQQRITPAAA